MEIRFQPYRKSGTWVVYWKSSWTGAHHHRGFYTQEEAENFVRECPAYTLLYQFSPKDTGQSKVK